MAHGCLVSIFLAFILYPVSINGIHPVSCVILGHSSSCVQAGGRVPCADGSRRHAAQAEGDAAAPVHWALVKGAPEVVRDFLRAPPPDYDATYRAFAAQGGRCARHHGSIT